jgi:ssDNA-binding Zn-finger/Zn-ribbon topoisomerase 1
MKIHKIESEYGNDFYATYECEHCGHVTAKKPGYHDQYFHTQVIPGQWCPECGKNRAGAIKERGDE